MRNSKVTALFCGLILLACSGQPAAAPMRGITLSTHGIGLDWAEDRIIPTMDAMAETGANWVAIHPYAGIGADGTVSIRHYDPSEPPEHVLRPIREARARGMRIFIKPHLAYWRSPWSWRGEIDFEDRAAWARFFATYRAWIVKLAEQVGDVDLFAVGTELDRTLDRPEWEGLVREIRAVTKAPLVYAANWTDYQRVPFQDQLDYIGVQAYFPLSELENPDVEELHRGWARICGELRNYSQSLGQRIVFTELGYNRSWAAAREPWSYSTDGPESEELQARCLEVALGMVELEPCIAGAFLWKWFPEPHPVGRNFQLATPRLLRVMRDVWAR